MTAWRAVRLAALLGLINVSSFIQANEGVVVLGSFKNGENAERQQRQLEKLLKTSINIANVTVDGVRYYRVVTDPIPKAEAQILIADAQLHGVAGWFSPGTDNRNQALRMAQPPGTTVPSFASLRRTSQETATPVNQPSGSTRTAPQTGDLIEIPYFDQVDIVIDGKIDESAWAEVPAYDDLRVTSPDTLGSPTYQTITRLLYTNQGLYVSGFMEQPHDTLVSQLSSRDKYVNRDGFGITLDTSGEGLYGYWFMVNLGGSVLDGKVAPERSMSEQWDGPWEGQSTRVPGGWSVEMFLPWPMMAIPDAKQARTMGIWVVRKIASMSEEYSWPALPRSQPRFMSALQSIRLPALETKQQLAVFPYVSANHDAMKSDQDMRAGTDIAWRPSTNLQLTAALSPDFGSVESDDVVVNLTAYETFFPEKRLFFLEGNEVFTTTPRSDPNRYGSSRGGGSRATAPTYTPEPTTFLNTRRIGGPPRHVSVPDDIEVASVELGKPTDLLGAVKLTGSSGRMRYGVLAAFEDEVELPGVVKATGERITVQEDGRDFGVIRALYEQSDGARRSVGYIGTVVTLPDDNAMTHGIDAHLLSSKGKVQVDGQLLYSDVGEQPGYGGFVDISIAQRRGINHSFEFDYIDKNLDISDLGFISQNDMIATQYGVYRFVGHGLKYFRRVTTSVFMGAQANTDGFLTRMGIYTGQGFEFPNYSNLRLSLNYYAPKWDDINSRGNGMFKVDSRMFLHAAYGTNSAKRISWSGTLGAQQEELNGQWGYSADVGFTLRASDRMTFDLDLRYKQRDGWLLHRWGRNFATYEASDFQPRIEMDYFFNARQQLRFTMQWAGIRAKSLDYYQVPESEGELIARDLTDGARNEDFSLSRLTAQLRYRWELGPLSDLFIVYTRGSNLAIGDMNDGFEDLFAEAIDEPVVDFLIAKLRYRFGR